MSAFPLGFVRLTDMINYQLFALCNLLAQLRNEEAYFQMAAFEAATGPDKENPAAQLVPQFQRERIEGLLKFATHCADRLELQSAHDRIELFFGALRRGALLSECSIQLRTLREAFESGIQYICFYHYPNAKAEVIKRVEADWATVFSKLDYVKKDIVAAVDCYALDHNSASVFHLMMAMERSVQAFGKLLKVDIVKLNPGRRVSELTWEQILNELNPKLKAMPQDTVAKKRRHQKLSATQSYLFSVKDAWRNPTMHPRKDGYTSLQNLDLINHVRSFLTNFAEVA